MRIFVSSKGRADTITVHKYLTGTDYYIVLHNKSDKADYLKNPTIDPNRIIVAEVPYGMTPIREFISSQLVEPNEWWVSMDDNVEYMRRLSYPWYDQFLLDKVHISKHNALWRERFEEVMPVEDFMLVAQDMAARGDEIGAYNIGFATTDNPVFRAKKFNDVAYIKGKVMVRKNVGIHLDPNVLAMDDYSYTAECLLQHGKVLRNNYVAPVAGHYQAGGIGTYDERLEMKIKDCNYLLKKYPDLFRRNKKKTADARAELALRFNNTYQVQKWRDKILYLRKHGLLQ